MLRPLPKIAMRHQRPSAILPKNAGLRDRRAGPPGCANNHSLIGRTSTMGPQEVDQKKNQKGCSGNMLPFGHRLMHVNGLPGPGMPRIQKLANLGPVGVLSSCCTTISGRTHRSDTRPRPRL
ncbi:hypothetical protein CPT34_24385 [Rhizobium sophoriradicis]|uniref:Uncharacterized protein n=1 Tax=Rhizobium sophoriradicis TaxID=1535245 RepID=A0A2A5KN43_9HYPH|nr:hypothetical protein CPT34_24385 [Rhizobium sophoriradicis]PDS69603.1 hypothetical protein CO651_22730 [Rhizobium phaseoli]